jgi:NMD protein affecting ribosome stability and mRNA decay
MRRKRSTTHTASRSPRPARRIHDEAPGQRAGKLPEIAGCPDCGASYRSGRWTWKTPPADSYAQVCPACERIASGYPAGVLHVEGDFARSHRDDLVGLIRNVAEREGSEHPLKRIMAIADEGSGWVVTATDAKLVESLGRALEKAYDGQLEPSATTSDKENLVRVRWRRD